jgi:carbon-monoxide dehydrogenase large subunit
MTRYSISQPVDAVEAPRLLKGKGRYTDDIQLPRMAHAVFLRSPHAHADLGRVDVTAANQMPGVIAILTGEDWAAENLGNVPGTAPPKRRGGQPGYRPPRPALTRDRVRHVGQAIAVVVAESVNQAKDAAEAIEVDFHPLPVQTDPEKSLDPSAPRIWEECENNEAFYVEKGDAAATEEALKTAPHVVRDTFVVTRVTANTMEPRAVVAQYDEGRDHYTVYACQQRPFAWRTMMAKHIFDMPENQITMIAGDVGGSFGMKGGLYPEVPVVAWAARRIGRPVKWNCERSEGHIADDQARDVRVEGELGFDDEGNFLAVRFKAVANVGAFLSMSGFGTPNGIAGATCGTYAVPTVYGRSSAVFTNTCPMANYRGPSGTPGSYVLERLVDMAAREIGMDPAEIRRRNYIPADAMPYKLPTGASYDCGEFEAVMDKCLAQADYANAAKRRDGARARGKLYGVGVSASVDPSGSPSPESIELRFDPGGAVTIMAASTAGGQNHATIYTQIVSDMLGLDAEKIRVVEGETDKLSWGSGTGAARTATICGSTVFFAVEKTREKGRRIAAHLLESKVDDVEFEDGVYSVPGTNRSITFSEVAVAAFKPSMLPPGEEIGMYETASWQPERSNIPNTFHICEVEVEPETGVVEVVRYNVVYDVGVELNPTHVRGQAQGAIAMGLGQALMEKMAYEGESGQVLTGSFMDYCMPRADDFCRMEFASHPVPTKTNPLGVKGAGEGGTVGSLPAVMNAVNDALAPLGVKNLMMPATPERVWRAIHEAQAAANGAA